MTEQEKMELARKKNPLEKIADMTAEMAKLVLVTYSLSNAKGKDGKPRGYAEIGDTKLSEVLGIDKSRIGGTKGLIYEAAVKGYLCVSNIKTKDPVLKDGKVLLNKKGETIFKSHRVFSQNMAGIRAAHLDFGVELPEKLQEKSQEFIKNQDKSKGISR